jgi:hypothetical protein
MQYGINGRLPETLYWDATGAAKQKITEPFYLDATITSEKFSNNNFKNPLAAAFYAFTEKLTFGLNSDPKLPLTEGPFKKSLNIDNKIDLTITNKSYNLLLDFPKKSDFNNNSVYTNQEIESFKIDILSFIVKKNTFYLNLDENIKLFFDDNFEKMKTDVIVGKSYIFPLLTKEAVTDEISGKVLPKDKFSTNLPNILLNRYIINYSKVTPGSLYKKER